MPVLAAPPAVIAPDAAALVATVRAYTGDPYATSGMRFTFIAGDKRRTLEWDTRRGRVAVAWQDAEGHACSAVAPVGYAGEDAVQAAAWAMFVNDSFWLFAPAKLAEAGATVSRDGDALTVRYDGVGLTPGDTYTFRVDPTTGEVRSWTFHLASGRDGTFDWAPATAVGPLHLSLTRTSGERTIRFEDVAVERVRLGRPGGACE